MSDKVGKQNKKEKKKKDLGKRKHNRLVQHALRTGGENVTKLVTDRKIVVDVAAPGTRPTNAAKVDGKMKRN